jgi:hypothetical protein
MKNYLKARFWIMLILTSALLIYGWYSYFNGGNLMFLIAAFGAVVAMILIRVSIKNINKPKV